MTRDEEILAAVRECEAVDRTRAASNAALVLAENACHEARLVQRAAQEAATKARCQLLDLVEAVPAGPTGSPARGREFI